MPHLGAAPDAAPGWLHQGAALRSSAGYGNELGIPGPSRHLTPLAQGLQAANLCSLPAASAADAAPAAAAEHSNRAPLLLQPLAQERPADLPPMLSFHSPQQPATVLQHPRAATGSDALTPHGFQQSAGLQHMEPASGHGGGLLIDDFEASGGLSEEVTRPFYEQAGRDLRDSAWGPPSRPQQPSAPPFPRSDLTSLCIHVCAGVSAMSICPVKGTPVLYAHQAADTAMCWFVVPGRCNTGQTSKPYVPCMTDTSCCADNALQLLCSTTLGHALSTCKNKMP